MKLYIVRHGRVRYNRLGKRMRQRWCILVCWLTEHKWSSWRRETEDWFEHIPAPTRWGDWRSCRRCSLSEWVTKFPPAT